MPATFACPDAVQFARLVEGRLPPADLEQFARHLENCPACGQRLDMHTAPTEVVKVWRGVAERAAVPPESRLWALIGRIENLQPDQHLSAVTQDYLSRADVSTLDGLPRLSPGLRDIQIPGYEILGELGRGGMGVVYRARQLSLKRVVALKMILAGAHAGAEEVERFCREAEAVARLQHPNIVQIYEIASQAGVSYFSLELVEGGPLSRRLKEALPPPDRAAALVSTVARAMDHAHQRGVIHRDLKPANVLLMTDGTPKITDFGLAKQLEADSAQTRTGAVMGTPSYMAPEQALGRSHDIGPLTDVYALGAILYEALTGRPPFRGDSILETLEDVRTKEPEPPSKVRPGVPRDLETICLKCLAKDPQQRYASALALANDLDRFRAGEPILARREGILARARRTLRRHAGKIAAAVLIALVSIAALLVVFSERTSSRVAELEKEILSALDESKLQGAVEYVAAVERLIDELAELAPDRATEERQKLWQRLGQWTQKEMDSATDPIAVGVRLNPIIALIAKHEPLLAQKLTTNLNGLPFRWEALFQLAAPFADATRVLPPGSFKIEGKSLQARAKGAKSKESSLGLVLTNQNSPSNAETRVTFQHPSWEQARYLGLAVNATAKSGYVFVLRPADDDAAKKAAKAGDKGESTTLAAARKEARPLHWQIQRNGEVLAQQVIAAHDLPQGPLEMWVKREGDMLRCQVQRFNVLEFFDPIPLGGAEPGVFGLVASGAVEIEKWSGMRRKMRPRATSLEQGDALFEQERYDDAIAQYRLQADRARNPQEFQQARYKEALCWLATSRANEAVPLLKEVANAEGPRWPLMANCQLWLLLAERKDTQSQQEADAVIEHLLGRKGLGEQQLAKLLPQKLRQRLIHSAEPSAFDLFFRAGKDRLLRAMQRTVAMERVLETDFTRRRTSEMTLARIYRLVDQEPQAFQLTRDILNQYQALESSDIARQTLDHHLWILRRWGRQDEALFEVDRWINGDKVDNKGNRGLYMLPERARINAARNQWQAAEKDIDLLLHNDKNITRGALLDGWCLKGTLRAEAGDAEGARLAWQRGVAAFKYAQLPDRESFGPMLNYSLMASLSGDISDEDARKIQRFFLARLTDENQVKNILDFIVNQQPTSVYREMWRSPRGRKVARQWALRQCSYAEYGQLPLVLLATETFRQMAFTGPLSDDQDQAVWDVSHSAFQHYTLGKISEEHVLMLGITFKGSTFVWDSVAKKLEPELRGRIAHLLGHRYLRINQAKQAAVFFETALRDAPPGSTVHRLAQVELAKLPKR
jgi:hypothetical protein